RATAASWPSASSRGSGTSVGMPNRHWLLLSGPAQGEPDLVLLSVGSTDYLAQPVDGWALYHRVALSSQMIFDVLQQRLIPLGGLWLSQGIGAGISGPTFLGSTYRVGEPFDEPVGERLALRVDQIDPATGRVIAHLWLDPITGAILRRQQFGGRDGVTLLWEYALTGIAYNQGFPAELFDPRIPWQGGYAQDYTGRPVDSDQQGSFTPVRPTERMLYIPIRPPAGFDPSHSRLTFQFAQDFSLPPALLPFGFPPLRGSPAMYPAEIFADSYYLGEVEFIDPWTALCARSADGLRIAYSSAQLEPGQKGSVLAWFSLKDLSKVRRISFEGILRSFSISPDGRRLAAFSFNQSSGVLSGVDLATGKTSHLLSVEDAASLVWSPDGQYLAMVATGADLHSELVVIRADSGQIVQRSPYDGSAAIPAASLVARWRVDFPVKMGDLEACAAAPR
ncbi:MAG TPA: hypothetical protein VF498_11540, partial [Anaerolineales bacterium]